MKYLAGILCLLCISYLVLVIYIAPYVLCIFLVLLQVVLEDDKRSGNLCALDLALYTHPCVPKAVPLLGLSGDLLSQLVHRATARISAVKFTSFSSEEVQTVDAQTACLQVGLTG